jgi:fructose-1,6-bisphosphatase/inositol monophosphatase family enzyme
MALHDDHLLAVLDEAAAAVQQSLEGVGDRGLIGAAGAHAGQHHSDLVADAAAVAVLHGSGLRVLSEESGISGEGDVTVVLDPLDGSTNFAHGIPWFAASLCAVDAEGPVAAVVRNLASGVTYRAVRGQGAERDGAPIAPSGATRMDDSILGLSGYPGQYLGWRQYRALGAAALDLCAVADGTLDGYIDCSYDALGAWDYLGAVLVCHEAGACAADLEGRDLATLQHDARRTMVAGATEQLCAQAAEARRLLH